MGKDRFLGDDSALCPVNALLGPQPLASQCAHIRYQKVTMNVPRQLLGLIVLPALLLACDAESVDPSTTPDGGAPAGCKSLSKVQGPFEECCPDHGLDACGANLFCAALDGRTIPTCYANNSQTPGEECHADDHCSSAVCSLSANECVGSLGSVCSAAAGCRDSACFMGTCQVTAGVPLAVCDSDDDCESTLSCIRGRCGVKEDEACTADAMCASRMCVNETCDSCTTDSQCASHLGNTFERCVEGRCLHTCKNNDHCGKLSMYAGSDACVWVGSGCEPYFCATDQASKELVCQ